MGDHLKQIIGSVSMRPLALELLITSSYVIYEYWFEKARTLEGLNGWRNLSSHRENRSESL
jgi:hypothetical protein